MEDNDFDKFLAAIVDNNVKLVAKLLKESPILATTQTTKAFHYESPINHWHYVGDVALHMAAAGYLLEIAQLLLDHGSDPNSYGNHRASGPLHYAADGYVSDPNWNENNQLKMLTLLLNAGANIHAVDKNGATPLHRAVRTRCSAAVKFLLDAGANPYAVNKSGSTPFHLAVQNTGRGGSGDSKAIEQQKLIIEEFLRRKISVNLRDGKCKTVLECAKTSWIKELLGNS